MVAVTRALTLTKHPQSLKRLLMRFACLWKGSVSRLPYRMSTKIPAWNTWSTGDKLVTSSSVRSMRG